MDAKWKTISGVLGAEGFVYVHSPIGDAISASRYTADPSDGWFFGTLQAQRGAISVYLSVPDLSFQRPPSVWLPQRPPWLLGWRPHLIQCDHPLLGEWLCYSDHEQFQLLPHQPARALLRVLADAKVTLNRIADPVTVIEDSQRELALLWDRSPYRIHIDVEPSDENEICRVGVVTQPSRTDYLVSHDPIKLAAKLGISGAVPIPYYAMVFPEPTEPLYLTSDGPPQTLKDIREWLQQVSPELHGKWRTVLKSTEQYKMPLYLHFFRSGGQAIGFHIPPEAKLRSVNGGREIKRFIERALFKNTLPITRLSATRLDDTYLIRRNLAPEMSDLRGLKILVIGCGTIGGYLSWSLVQLGAGLDFEERKGTLCLCDSQILTSQNIGRHFLGMNYLGEFKATALKTELSAKRPGAAIVDIRDHFASIENRIDEYDVVINATGYESFGRYISILLRRQNWFTHNRALLHTWIEGRGGVTRALLEDSLKAACFDCMWDFSVNQEPRLRYAAYADAALSAHSTDGYATMTPFAVSASLAAVSLAVDLILAWRSGRPSPKFRSRSTEGDRIKPSVSIDLSPHRHCPSCST
jgi:molybdopterin/thiamine biosynthesis adenylyltransferase